MYTGDIALEALTLTTDVMKHVMNDVSGVGKEEEWIRGLHSVEPAFSKKGDETPCGFVGTVKAGTPTVYVEFSNTSAMGRCVASYGDFSKWIYVPSEIMEPVVEAYLRVWKEV